MRLITNKPSIISDDAFCELVSVPHNWSENMSLTDDNSDVSESKNGIKSESGYKKICTLTTYYVRKYIPLQYSSFLRHNVH